MKNTKDEIRKEFQSSDRSSPGWSTSTSDRVSKMRRLKILTILVLGLLATTAQVQAFTFSFPGSSQGNNQPPPGPVPWAFRPLEPSNARGVPPSYPSARQPRGQYPGRPPGQMQMPGYQPAPGYQPGWPRQYGTPYRQQQSRQQASRPPRLELEISNNQPYLQENVLLKLRVISDQNLETATPELPSSNDLLLQKLEGPNARARNGVGGHREIVNEFVYILTPLHAGDLELPALSVNGIIAGSGQGYGRGAGRRYEARSEEPIHLQVRPAVASVRPWLPLENLSLSATLDEGGDVEEGQPVTLVLELNALGATGSQLPSMEPFLRSADFRVYRDQTLTEGKLSSDGRRLEGRRTEYYTLVPSSGGRLLLPEIRLPWWNVRDHTREHAGLPIHTLDVNGESGPFGVSQSAQAQARGSGGASRFWLPIIGLALLLFGYWAGIWFKGRADKGPDREPMGARVLAAVRAAGSRAGSGVAAITDRLNPAPLFGQIRPVLARALPASSRFLSCVRAANRETDPTAWAERFQVMTCRHVHFDAQTPLPGITGQILRLRPGADKEQLERLMQQLDGALYGKQDIDFRRWKRQFNRQIGRSRGLIRSGIRRSPVRRPRLPELNPQAG